MTQKGQQLLQGWPSTGMRVYNNTLWPYQLPATCLKEFAVGDEFEVWITIGLNSLGGFCCLDLSIYSSPSHFSSLSNLESLLWD
ncbi:hypothetical protein Sjap_009455 [Stephania japonica]|uniref:Uncharacterized protein n=1 Tax=Stephania japonica TaxID=461633 RepID=A0AAP0JRE5_9MAGN